MAIVPMELSLTFLKRKDLQASCGVREGMLREELDREPREIVLG